jgi:streptogramin lyase
MSLFRERGQLYQLRYAVLPLNSERCTPASTRDAVAAPVSLHRLAYKKALAAAPNDPASKSWTVHKLPGDQPHAYAVYVDEKGKVWVSDFGANAILSFDPNNQAFESFPSDKPDAAVRQLNGRAGEVWGAESATDRLVVIRATGN